MHVIIFTLTPLIFAAIFYASNTNNIAFIDCLFLCVSAMSLTGLATVNISATTAWQQAILFFLMAIGNLSAVSFTMVLIRRHFFQLRFQDVIKKSAKTRKRMQDVEEAHQRERDRQAAAAFDVEKEKRRHRYGPLRADMIRRTDEPAVLVNSSGMTTSNQPEPVIESILQSSSADEGLSLPANNEMNSADSAPLETICNNEEETTKEVDILSPLDRRRHLRRKSEDVRIGATKADGFFPRTQTVEFAEPSKERKAYSQSIATATEAGKEGRLKQRITHTTLSIEPTNTVASRHSSVLPPSRHRGFGGFPTPLEAVNHVVERLFPKLQRQITRTTTIPQTSTFASTHSVGESSRPAPYLTFSATVSRNSRFQDLSEAQKDELGGVEYRALDLLAKLLPVYWLTIIFFFVTLVAPWLASRSAQQVHSVLDSQGVNTPNTTWMWFFQVVSAYSNTGLSLIDTSMAELPTQYFMLIPIAILILAGNTAFPIFLRFFLWVLSKSIRQESRLYETLRFLLDHPRRCFVYLFPSGQTWFLLVILVILNITDWIAFEVLDIGNTAVTSLPVGQRTFDGLFQAIAVRTAGFQVVSLLSIAPAVQILYVIMMYISAYPIAMSVRNTNVYEEQSLGVYKDEEPSEVSEPSEGGARVWGKYLTAHARRQLAFDLWWLGLALWILCIIERHAIQDPGTDQYFTIFNCLFELVSAYGTVGLSTGLPNEDFSLSGQFSTLGKLVVIAVMLRGRHRGLPVAIDRAVLLPGEMEIQDDAQESQRISTEYSIPMAYTHSIPNTSTRRPTQPTSDSNARSQRHSVNVF
jgi:Trk-type K+ transport system membrane component